MCVNQNNVPPIAQLNQNNSTLIRYVFWDFNFEKNHRLKGIRPPPPPPIMIYNALVRPIFCGVVEISTGDLGGGKRPSVGFPPLLRLFCVWVSVLPGSHLR